MAKDEEYEIMPHKTIKNIKKEIQNLKRKSKKTAEVASPEFKKSIDNLTKSMNSLMELFQEAAEEMKIEDRTQENIDDKLGPLVKKVSQIENENKEIAEGIVTVADMVKDLRKEIESKKPMPPIRPVLKQQHFEKPKNIPRPPPGMEQQFTEKPIPKPKFTHINHPKSTPPLTGGPMSPEHKPKPSPHPPKQMPPMPPSREAMPQRPEAMPPPGPMPQRNEAMPSKGMPQRPEAMPQRPEAMPPPGPMPPRGMPEPRPFPQPDMEPPEPKKKKGFLSGIFKK